MAVEKFKGGPVDAVEDEKCEEEPPRLGGGKEVGVDTAGVFEYELDS